MSRFRKESVKGKGNVCPSLHVKRGYFGKSLNFVFYLNPPSIIAKIGLGEAENVLSPFWKFSIKKSPDRSEVNPNTPRHPIHSGIQLQYKAKR
ncbi:hypothetical protein M5K25_012497 [Dendrobium thyrsiflorum]|uniref:Uncharacterized protein n=1 Tax=Dendrobium thyrsiflorum TaxID=117978 RepID=A0ABD0V4B2_DENTH